MSLSKVWLIIRREYLYNLMRRSFLFTAFVLPLIIVGSMYLGFTVASPDEDDLDEYERFGYVDQSGVLADVPTEVDFERYQPFTDEAAARAAFDTRDIQGYFVVPADYLDSGRIVVYSEKSIPINLREEIDDFMLAGVAQAIPADLPLERLKSPLEKKIHILGEEGELDEEAAIARVLLPIVFTMLLVITVLTSSQFLMSGVVEEKENRISEVLLTSARPLELMVGKVVGLGGLALTQMLFTVLMGLTFGLATGRLDILGEMNFQLTDVLVALVYFLLSFTLFASLMLGIGATVSAEQESRQIAAVFVIIAILPVYAIGAFFTNPTGPLPTGLSLFPLTAPVSVLLLITMGELRDWQLALSLLITLLSIAVVIWAASRLFQRGILMYDQRLSLRQIAGILRSQS